MSLQPVSCPNCDGTGEVYSGRAPQEQISACDNCEGTGSIQPDSMFYEWAVEWHNEQLTSEDKSQ